LRRFTDVYYSRKEEAMRALNQAERELFGLIISGGHQHLALVSTECNGVETGCISWVKKDGKEYQITPLAVLVNDQLFAMLEKP
jgi:hypothetical protein